MSIIHEDNKSGRILTWRRRFIDYVPHFHDTIELVYVLDGNCTARGNFCDHNLEKGDLFIAFPNQIHSYCNEQNIDCYLFLFPSAICPELAHFFDTKIPKCPHIRSGELSDLFLETIEHIYKYSHSPNFYHKQMTKGYFAVLLSLILQKLELTEMHSTNPTTEKKIINYCTENFQKPLTLDILAKELYVSRYHISHLFSSKLKISFNDFLNQLRVNNACERLKHGECVTDVAFESGFSSIRTFNRAFLKEIGMNPRNYIKNINEPKE